MTAAPTHALFKIALDFLRDVRKLSSKVHTFKKLRIYRCIYLFIKQFQHDIPIVGSERILRIFLATIVGLVFAIILVIVCCCFKVRREQVIIHELTTLFKKKKNFAYCIFSIFTENEKTIDRSRLDAFRRGSAGVLESGSNRRRPGWPPSLRQEVGISERQIKTRWKVLFNVKEIFYNFSLRNFFFL